MNKLGKMAVRATSAFLAFLLLIAAGLALAPRWINLEPIRNRIVESASRKLGAQLTCDRLDLTLFPRPRIVLYGAKVRIPGTADGTISSIEITPTIVSLIRGEILLARVRADEPDFRLFLPSPKKGDEKPLTLQEIREKAARVLSILSNAIPGAVIELSRGHLTLVRDNRTLHDFTDLSSRIDAPPDTLRVEVTCASSLWGRLTAKIRLDPEGLKAMGEIRVKRLAADRLAPFIPAGVAIGYTGAFPDLELNFESADFRTLRADIRGTLPAISIRRSPRRGGLDARGIRFSGAIRLDSGALSLTDLRLSSESPPLKASGEYSHALPASRAAVSIRAEEVDVPALRKAILAFAGDVAPFPTLFDWLRGGTFTSLAITSQARSPSALDSLDAIALKGTLRNGRIHVGPGKLDLSEVSGAVSLARGVMTAGRVSARLGESRATDASIAVSLGRKGFPFRIEAPIRADLSQLPDIMGRLPLPAEAAALFAGISSLDGSAAGRMTIEGDGTSIRTGVSASSIRLAGRHRKIPLPFTVTGGNFSLSGKTIRIGGHAGTIGRTKFSGVEGRLQIGGDYPVDNVSGRIEADLGELSAWASSVPGFAAATGGITATGGTADLSVSLLEGPLLRPKALRFDGTATIVENRLAGGKLPGPVTFHSGRIRATPETLSFESIRGSMLDADLKGSVAWTGYREGRRAFEVTALGGTLGPESVGRLMAFGKVRLDFKPRTPIELSDVRAGFGADNAVAIAGTLSVRGGPVVAVDLAARPGTLDIRSISLRDESSDATASLTKSPEALALRFSGRLAASSIGRLFPARKTGNESISGDIRLRIPNDNVLRLSANGRLEAKAIRVPELLGPLSIDRLDIEAAGNRLSVREAALAWDGKPFDLKGTLVNGASGLSTDLDLHAATLSREEIGREIRRFAPAAGKTGRPWRLPVTGMVRVTSDVFTWDRFEWKPMRADVLLEPHAVSVAVKEASLCGISTPGTVRVTPEGTSVDFQATATDRAIDTTLSCLKEDHFRMTGTWSLAAHVAGESRGDGLVASLKGPVTFEARKGRIHKANVLMKVLALLNVTQILVGKMPDLAEDGFAYSSLKFTGTVADGKVVVPDLVLDAASANIAAEGSVDLVRKEVDGVLVASPFKTIDAVIRMIPIVRYILKGRLVAVPFKFSGPLGDPDVSILPTAGVGSGLLGVLERTIKLPVHLIEPMLPKEQPPPDPRPSP